MKILVLSGKHGDTMVCARTPDEEDRAWLYLFECIDNQGYYVDFDGNDEVSAYWGARKGGAKAAKWLLEMRCDCEYEQVTIEHVVEP